MDGAGMRFAAVAARYNEAYTSSLLDGALCALEESGVDRDDVDIVWVPGSFEIPLAARHQAESGRYDAVICIGVVIRSDTPHFEYVAGEASRGIMDAGLKSGVPVIFSVLTVENEAQAQARTLPDDSNRGYNAGQVGIQMASLMRKLR